MSTLRNRATPAKYSGQLNATATRWREDEPPQHRPYLQERFEALQCALTRPVVVMCEVPFVLRNAGNGSQGASMAGRRVRNETRKAQRQLGAMFAREMLDSVRDAFNLNPRIFAVVVLTRIAPRTLDGNNLDHAFKGIIDGIAEGLGINDRSSLVRYCTSQEQGKTARVRCELFIEPRP